MCVVVEFWKLWRFLTSYRNMVDLCLELKEVLLAQVFRAQMCGRTGHL